MESLKTKIPKHIFDKLEIVNITDLRYFLTEPIHDICDKLRLCPADIKEIISASSDIILNQQFKKVQEVKWPLLRTGCPIITEALNGISCRGITEFYGESGSGKTQICLQMALDVQRPVELGGLNGGAVYICTEGPFPSKRFHEMSEFQPENYRKNFSDNLFIEHVFDLEQFQHCLQIRLPVLLSQKRIRLVVVDSIAGIFRYDHNACDYISRSEDLQAIAAILCDFSVKYDIAVVCTNQITWNTNPCLGLSWSNLIRTRIQIARLERTITVDGTTTPVRSLRICFAPDTPPNKCNFIVTKDGVKGIQ